MAMCAAGMQMQIDIKSSQWGSFCWLTHLYRERPEANSQFELLSMACLEGI